MAEDICDVPADTIREMARGLGENRPKSMVHPGWGGGFGASMQIVMRLPEQSPV